MPQTFTSLSSHMLTVLRRALNLALPLSALLLACNAGAQLQVSRIQVRVLNGHNGKPVTDASTSTLMLPETTFSMPILTKTDRNGIASVLVLTTSEVKVTVPHHATCEYTRKSDRKLKGPSAYPVQHILSTGVLGTDRCGHPKLKPNPAELTIFVRPSHWWQRVGY